jgi:hypothetical protein
MNAPKAVLYSTEESPTGLVFTILEGKFSGLEYQYGTVSIKEPDDGDDHAVLSFTHEIVYDPTGNGKSILEENKVDMMIAMGDILYEIIMGNDAEV